MLTLEAYTSHVEEALKNLELPAQPAGLYEPIRYALDGGGKRLRPVLVLAAADAFGFAAHRAINQAMAVELFHNFTLLHDDVMDHSDMRRGRPSVHRRWDERTAILSGDAMLTLATQMAAKCSDTALKATLQMFNRTAMEVYEGQQIDMDFESDDDVTVEQYLEMIRLKTSVLLGCSCALGAIAAGADEKSVKSIYAFGEKLGLAFQLQDDYLDTYGDPMVFGKPIGGDIINNKKTWLRIMASRLDTSGTIHEETVNPSEEYIKIKRVTEVYDRLMLPDKCKELINHYINQAISHVKECGLDSEAEDFFTSLALRTANRTH